MNKAKISDFFFAGIVFGIINGLINNLYIVLLRLFHVNTGKPWEDAAALFFREPERSTFAAQLFGFLMSMNAPIFISIALCLLVKLSGRDYIYVKSIAIAELTTFFTFVAVFPPLGVTYLKHSIATVWGALFGMLLFGISLGYLVKKFTDLGYRQ